MFITHSTDFVHEMNDWLNTLPAKYDIYQIWLTSDLCRAIINVGEKNGQTSSIPTNL